MYIDKPIRLAKFVLPDNHAICRDFNYGDLSELPSKTFTVDKPEDIKCCGWGFHAVYKECAWEWCTDGLYYYIVEVWGLVDYDKNKVSVEHMRFIELKHKITIGLVNYNFNNNLDFFNDIEDKSSFINYKLPYRMIKAWMYKLKLKWITKC